VLLACGRSLLFFCVFYCCRSSPAHHPPATTAPGLRTEYERRLAIAEMAAPVPLHVIPYGLGTDEARAFYMGAVRARLAEIGDDETSIEAVILSRELARLENLVTPEEREL